MPESNLLWAILSTTLGCLPLGIVAIVKAVSVETLWCQDRFDEAEKAANDAKKYSLWSLIAAVIGWTLYILVIIIAAILLR